LKVESEIEIEIEIQWSPVCNQSGKKVGSIAFQGIPQVHDEGERARAVFLFRLRAVYTRGFCVRFSVRDGAATRDWVECVVIKENAEKCKTKITQPLTKLPFQARSAS
jgi:hypothetical protein